MKGDALIKDGPKWVPYKTIFSINRKDQDALWLSPKGLFFKCLSIRLTLAHEIHGVEIWLEVNQGGPYKTYQA